MSNTFLELKKFWQQLENERKAENEAIFKKRVHDVLSSWPNVDNLAVRVVELETTIEALRKELSYSKANEVPEYNMRNN